MISHITCALENANGLRSAPRFREGLNHPAAVNALLREINSRLGSQRIRGRGEGFEFGGRDGHPDFLAILTADFRAPPIRLALESFDNVGLIVDCHGRGSCCASPKVGRVVTALFLTSKPGDRASQGRGSVRWRRSAGPRQPANPGLTCGLPRVVEGPLGFGPASPGALYGRILRAMLAAQMVFPSA